jgi:hypothetical protein
MCQSYTKFLKVQSAARIADVTTRTIYRYVESGEIYKVEIAGKTTRICTGCLIKREEDDH